MNFDCVGTAEDQVEAIEGIRERSGRDGIEFKFESKDIN